MKFFTRNRLSKILQGQKGKNYTTFDALCYLGWSPADARNMLIVGNKIRIRRLANGTDVSPSTIYAACDGRRRNPIGQELLSKALDIPVPELFPDASNG